MGRSYDSRRVLIVGTGEIARDMYQAVQSYAWAGLYVTGFVDEGDGQPVDESALKAPVLGTLDDVAKIIEEHDISEVLIALPSQKQLDVKKAGLRFAVAPHQHPRCAGLF